MSSPTQRSLAHLRSHGFIVDIVERQCGPIKKDFLGIIDLIALRPSTQEVLCIQTTSASNASSRVKKLQASDMTSALLLMGWEVIVHSWGKRGPRGGRKLWTLKEIPVLP